MHVVTASSISRIQIHQYEINILVVLDSSSSFGLGFDREGDMGTISG